MQKDNVTNADSIGTRACRHKDVCLWLQGRVLILEEREAFADTI